MFDTATAKTRLNITGTLQDAAINASISTALAVAERYCDRQFAYATDTVKFYEFFGHIMFLPRYPVASVISVTGLPSKYYVNGRLGSIEFGGDVHVADATINYVGGYQVLPADLELALWLLFDDIWAITPGGGSGAGASGGSGSQISSISVPDVGTLRFDNGKSANAGAGANIGAVGIIPANAINLLEPYRRRTC